MFQAGGKTDPKAWKYAAYEDRKKACLVWPQHVGGGVTSSEAGEMSEVRL